MYLANLFRRTYHNLSHKPVPAPFIREEVLAGLRYAATSQVMGA